MSLRKASVLCLRFAAFAAAIQAQRTTATFYAVVTDCTGGINGGATVLLVHEGTGAAANRTTSPYRGSCL